MPCDGIPDCEGGVDEHPSRCNVPKKITYYSLSIGYGIFFLLMLVALIYNWKKYVTSNKLKHFKSRYFILVQDLNNKLRSEMNRTKGSLKILLMESSGNNLISLSVFYLMMSVMKYSKNFGKIAILKI